MIPRVPMLFQITPAPVPGPKHPQILMAPLLHARFLCPWVALPLLLWRTHSQLWILTRRMRQHSDWGETQVTAALPLKAQKRKREDPGKNGGL